MLRAGTCYLEMFQYSAPEPDRDRPLRPYDKGYTHFCVDVTDIEQEYERLKGLGMTFSQPAPIDVGHVKSIYGRDPEGNLIEIQETRENCDFPLSALPPVPK
jgi:catechol 2,3-dioxygenase-like lactoylglutathione lyase family enzyme